VKKIGDIVWLVDGQVIDGSLVLDKEASSFLIEDYAMSGYLIKNAKTNELKRAATVFTTKESAENWNEHITIQSK
jgi:hypothetical protein